MAKKPRLNLRPLRGPKGLWAMLIATGLGAGFVPFAPGTAGSMVGWGIVWQVQTWSIWQGALFWIGLTVIGTWAIQWVQARTQSTDASEIVIDEIIGIALACWPAIGRSGLAWLLAFVLFRVFDILKPPPVRQFDRWSKKVGATPRERWLGAFWVIADDLLAGLMAAGCLLALLRLEWLG